MVTEFFLKEFLIQSRKIELKLRRMVLFLKKTFFEVSKKVSIDFMIMFKELESSVSTVSLR